MHNALVDIWSEYCMLVLPPAMTNDRHAVQGDAVDRSKFNKNPLKAARPPLLHH